MPHKFFFHNLSNRHAPYHKSSELYFDQRAILIAHAGDIIVTRYSFDLDYLSYMARFGFVEGITFLSPENSKPDRFWTEESFVDAVRKHVYSKIYFFDAYQADSDAITFAHTVGIEFEENVPIDFTSFVVLGKLEEQCGVFFLKKQWNEFFLRRGTIRFFDLKKDGTSASVCIFEDVIDYTTSEYAGSIFPSNFTAGEERIIILEASRILKVILKENYCSTMAFEFAFSSERHVIWLGIFPKKSGTFYAHEFAKRIGVQYYATRLIHIPKFIGRKFLDLYNPIVPLLFPINGKQRGVILYNVGGITKYGIFNVFVCGDDRGDVDGLVSILRMILVRP